MNDEEKDEKNEKQEPESTAAPLRPQPRMDPQPFSPPLDIAQFLSTNSTPSVEHPGQMIPTVIVAEMVLMKRMSITARQLNYIYSDPIELLAAPGDGLMWLIHTLVIRKPHGSAFTMGSSSANIVYGPPAAGWGMSIDNNPGFGDINRILTGASTGVAPSGQEESIYIQTNLNYGGPRHPYMLENQPVYLASNGNFLGGGSMIITLTLFYQLLQM